MPVAPTLLLVGPGSHGVVRYSRELAEAVQAGDGSVAVVGVPDVETAIAASGDVEWAHVHVTDRLFGASPEEAAASIEHLAAATRLTITIHDMPQPSDGSLLSRRAEAYARFLTAADGVAVNSRHEARLVEEHLGIPAASVAVIPLGTRVALSPGREAGADSAPPTSDALVALVAGYIYPGKGHLGVIRAVSAAAASLRAAGGAPSESAVVAVGGPSRGHEGDVVALQDEADSLGVRLRVTGFLDDDAYDRAMAGAGIPVAAHQHLSASRSMIDWIEHGRRPLVADSRYAREMAALRPGTMTLVDASGLAEALAAAWSEPASTRLAAGTSLGPVLASTAEAYRGWWAGLA